jgi:hypothetical protein
VYIRLSFPDLGSCPSSIGRRYRGALKIGWLGSSDFSQKWLIYSQKRLKPITAMRLIVMSIVGGFSKHRDLDVAVRVERNGSKLPIWRSSVDRRDRVESGHQTRKFMTSVMRCSDFRGVDHRLGVHGKAHLV